MIGKRLCAVLCLMTALVCLSAAGIDIGQSDARIRSNPGINAPDASDMGAIGSEQDITDTIPTIERDEATPTEESPEPGSASEWGNAPSSEQSTSTSLYKGHINVPDDEDDEEPEEDERDFLLMFGFTAAMVLPFLIAFLLSELLSRLPYRRNTNDKKGK